MVHRQSAERGKLRKRFQLLHPVLNERIIAAEAPNSAQPILVFKLNPKVRLDVLRCRDSCYCYFGPRLGNGPQFARLTPRLFLRSNGIYLFDNSPQDFRDAPSLRDTAYGTMGDVTLKDFRNMSQPRFEKVLLERSQPLRRLS